MPHKIQCDMQRLVAGTAVTASANAEPAKTPLAATWNPAVARCKPLVHHAGDERNLSFCLARRPRVTNHSLLYNTNCA